MSRWRVYYDDGSTWDWTQGLDGIPGYGVICILQIAAVYDGHMRLNDRYHIVYGCPYYMRADDQWLHAHENDIIDRLAHGMPIKHVLVGRMVTKKVFGEIYGQAKKDKDADNL